MVEPVTMSAAALMALGHALSGASSGYGAVKSAKIQAKETKRKTFAELLNEAMSRSHETTRDTRKNQADLSGARSRALQDMAAGIRQSLVR